MAERQWHHGLDGVSRWVVGWSDYLDLQKERDRLSSELSACREQVESLTRERDEAIESAGNFWTAIARAETAEAELSACREALDMIDALDPEDHVYGCSADALRGLVTRMGQTARAALSASPSIREAGE